MIDFEAAAVRNEAAQHWFGYGRWDAPFWFIGMEPGGKDDDYSYLAWSQLDPERTGLIDCRQHHLWKRDVLGIEDPLWTRWHDDRPGRRTQSTWRRLIQLLFSFNGQATDLDAVYAYQKYRLGTLNGETAVVELGALHAPGLATNVDRTTFRGSRIASLRQRLRDSQPVLALCYGYGFRDQFADVIDDALKTRDNCWLGNTLCFMAPGPTSFGSGADWWIEAGRMLRKIVTQRSDADSLYEGWYINRLRSK